MAFCLHDQAVKSPCPPCLLVFVTLRLIGKNYRPYRGESSDCLEVEQKLVPIRAHEVPFPRRTEEVSLSAEFFVARRSVGEAASLPTWSLYRFREQFPMRTAAWWMACLGILGTLLPFPSNCLAQPPVRDVALGDGGALVGTLTDDQGVPQPLREIAIYQQNQRVAVATTDAAGVYRLAELRGGVYVAVVDASASVFRAWSPGTAPPVARRQLNLAIRGQHTPTVRGQASFYEWGDTTALYDLMERNPLLTAGVIATLIAVPVAVIAHNQDSGDAS